MTRYKYRGDAYSKHVLIGEKTTITEAHFVRWLNLFTQEAHACLAKEEAQTIVKRANLIAGSLRRAMLNPTS